MKVDSFPLIGNILATGADDRVFDSLMLLGPALILVIAILGRSISTLALAATYLGVFLGYVVYKGAVE